MEFLLLWQFKHNNDRDKGFAMQEKQDYLERILTSRVYDVAIETPLELAPNLSRRYRNKILLKREDLQPVFSSSCAALTTRWPSSAGNSASAA